MLPCTCQRDLLDELFLLKSRATSRASFDSPTEPPRLTAGRGGFFAGGASSQQLGGASSQHLGGSSSQHRSALGGPRLIVGNEPASLDLHVGTHRRGVSGTLTRRRRRAAGKEEEGAMARGTAVDIGAEALCSVQLRPSQLTVLSDGVTLGFELPGASSGPTSWRTHPMSGSGGRCAVPAVQIGVQALCSWRQDDARFRVQYAAGALMAYDVGGVTCTPHLVRRSLEGPLPARAATSRWERMVLSASAR